MRQISKISAPTTKWSAFISSYTKGVPASLYPLGENLRIRVSAPFFQFTGDEAVMEAPCVSGRRGPEASRADRAGLPLFFSECFYYSVATVYFPTT